MKIISLLIEIIKLFNSLDRRISNLEDKQFELEEEIMALRDQIDLLVARVGELQTTLTEEVDELKVAFQDLRDRIEDLEGIDLSPQLNAISSAIAGIESLSDLAIAPDTEIPTTPASLVASNVTATTADLAWSASTDNVGVVGYEIFANGSVFSMSTSNSFSASGLTPESSYVFAVRAKDAAGNFSAMSDNVSVTTLPTA